MHTYGDPKIWTKEVMKTRTQQKDLNQLARTIEDHLTKDEYPEIDHEINSLEPAQVIKVLSRLSRRRRAIVYRLLEKDVALKVFEGLSPALQSDLLGALQEHETTELFLVKRPGFCSGGDVSFSDVSKTVVFAPHRAQFAVATAIGDTAKLFDIYVHQLTRCGFFLPNGFGLAHRQSSGLIDISQRRHPIPLECPTHRGAWYAQVIADPVRTPLAPKPQGKDPAFGLDRSTIRIVPWPRGTISQGQSCSIAFGPLRRCRS